MVTEETMADARLALAECLQELIENKGFMPPLQVVATGANGIVCMLSYEVVDDGLDGSIRFADQGEMALPVNMMIVDNRGEAARLLISVSGERRLLH